MHKPVAEGVQFARPGGAEFWDTRASRGAKLSKAGSRRAGPLNKCCIGRRDKICMEEKSFVRTASTWPFHKWAGSSGGGRC